MQFVPTEGDVIGLLRQTGALREGHFACPSGFHTDQYLETALVMRHCCHAKVLSVGLSRLLRAETSLRAILHDLSIVSATPAGMPVAYGLCEALRARQVYRTEKPFASQPMRFLQYFRPEPGEPVILADDVLRSGVLLNEAQALLESRGALVLALAVLIHQPTPRTWDFGSLPIFSLARLDSVTYSSPDSCRLCRDGVLLERIGKEPVEQALEARVLAAAD